MPKLDSLRRLRDLTRDPRHFQIAALGSLLLYGLAVLDLGVKPGDALAVLAVAEATQLLFTRLFGLPRFDPKSALISALSLTLLLRASSLPWLLAGAFVAVASKFLVRARGKHVFNPTNAAIVLLLLVSPLLPGGAWVSPAQWGSGAWLAFLLACAGQTVLRRAERSDVTWAFLAAWAALVLGRSLWLGDPLTVPLHGLQNGALLIFAFFMISDPKTTPDSRAGRIVFAAVVAAAGAWAQLGLFRPTGLLFALAAAAPLVPILDRLLPARRYRWPGEITDKEPVMSPGPKTRRAAVPATLLLVALLAAPAAHAFCGFYVARADTGLFNRASQVVLVRDGDKTVLTMVSDFEGDLSEFAMVVPVPTFLEREQIHVGSMSVIDHLDAYTAPRLVEYYDENPCWRERLEEAAADVARAVPAPPPAAKQRQVTIEASYTVGEYDILILSARQSDGLVAWLQENGYRIPPGAEPVVASYLKQGMRFFVAKVNLEEHGRLGFQTLRPLQIAFETPKFMLPIRLGTVNANGPQELFVYALTRTGRVETTNYRTVELPSDLDVPLYVKADFPRFYRDLFGHQVERQGMTTVFLEYAWDMAWCDPCAADPLTPAELSELGVFWLPPAAARGPAQDVFVTRLHVRYDREHFPQDLQFQETSNRANFQGRYVLRHPWQGSDSCAAAAAYRDDLRERREREARTLVELTGWELSDVRQRMGLTGETPEATPWWRRIWGG